MKYHVLKGNNLAFCGLWTTGQTEAKVIEGEWNGRQSRLKQFEPIKTREICARCLKLQTIYITLADYEKLQGATNGQT